VSFLDTVRRAKTYLEEQGRVSVRALRREFELDDDSLADLVEELVEIQGVATQDGPALAWCGPAPIAPPAPPERDPRAYTPKHLADKILQSKSALEGERKQVTVVFADVKGSMELAEQAGAENWHRILDHFFAVLNEGVHRFEGTVNQYTGDGIMALFGAPIAHEDHAQRACYAALQLRDDLAAQADEVKREYGLGFSTRIGINSGEVVVGKIGDDLRMDYTAQGLTVGLAQRMESLASPNSIYLSDATAALVGGYFTLDDLGEFPIKGVSEPVRVHQLTGVGALRTRFDVSRARGLTGFVGRDVDIQTLENALAQSLDGNAQVVGVVAEAGTGKSRLCFEFLESCRARGIRVNEGRAVAHGRSIPFLPMLQVFRSYYGIADDDDPGTVREKIASRLLSLGDEFRPALHLLFDFFGAPDPDDPAPDLDPDARQRQLFDVLRRVVQGEGDPFVTLIEDLHWLDPASEAFLEQWVEAAPGGTGLLVVNFRPEYHADWMQKSWYRQVPLAPLGPEAVQELLGDLLGTDPSVAELVERIHERTGGNPFFTEEVVQSLIESGQLEGTRGAYRLVTSAKMLEIPATVQSLLSARIDRLGEREKHVLQAAAVLGREFTEPILDEVAELPQTDLADALGALQAGEFVYEQSLYPVAEYIFKHALTQEVALGSQLKERRRGLHAAAARALEAARSDKLEENAALLAHHWEEAGEAWLATQWHNRAAEWAQKGDIVAALGHWQSAWTLSADLPDREEIAMLRLAICQSISTRSFRIGLSEEEMSDLAAEGRRLAEQLGDRGALISLIGGEGMRRGHKGDMRRYYELAREAAAVDAPSVDLDVRVFSQCIVAYPAHCTGRLAEALAALERVLLLSGGDPRVGFGSAGFSFVGVGHQLISLTQTLLGRYDEGCLELIRGLRFCREHELTEQLGWTLNVATYLAWMTGGTPSGAPECRAAAIESVEMADRQEISNSRVAARVGLTLAHRAMGDHAACAEASRETIALGEELGASVEWSFLPYSCLAHALREQGDARGAVEAATQSVALADRIGQKGWGIDALLALALAVLAAEESAAAERAEAHLARADEWLAETGARAFEPMILEARAELARVRGNANARERLRREALHLYREMGASGHAKRLDDELAG
jgi:class 3 adenylate cyclase/tetratricopeptide (TPR) repeat protein